MLTWKVRYERIRDDNEGTHGRARTDTYQLTGPFNSLASAAGARSVTGTITVKQWVTGQLSSKLYGRVSQMSVKGDRHWALAA